MIKKKKTTKTLTSIVNAASKSIKPGNSVKKIIYSALKGARLAVEKAGGKSCIRHPKILPVSSKIGGFLPYLIPLFAGLSAIGALAGGTSGVAKAINDAKAAKQQLEESRRHNKTMESIALGKGLYLKPWKDGYGLYLRPWSAEGLYLRPWSGEGLKKKKPKLSLPQKPLSNLDLIKYTNKIKVPYFRGVFMRDKLPAEGPRYNESAIINLDKNSDPGTHWVAYKKRRKEVIYFDSFGDLQPPTELMKYLGTNRIKYNPERYQGFGTFNCGHLRLKFLSGRL